MISQSHKMITTRLHIISDKRKTEGFQPTPVGTFFAAAIQGTILLDVGTRQIPLEGGYWYMIPCAHVIRAAPQNSNTRGICWCSDDACVSSHAEPVMMDDIMIAVLDDLLENSRDIITCSAGLTYLLARSHNQQVTHVPSPSRKNLADDVSRYIEANLDLDLSLRELCSTFQCSRAYLSKAFRQAGLSSPMRHVAAIRVQRASQSLQQSDLSIYSIATSVGFSDLASFSHFFRAQTGHSPRAYRQNCLWLQ
jgi:transcriptional regulator GlxA family with amidase domain